VHGNVASVDEDKEEVKGKKEGKRRENVIKEKEQTPRGKAAGLLLLHSYSPVLDKRQIAQFSAPARMKASPGASSTGKKSLRNGKKVQGRKK